MSRQDRLLDKDDSAVTLGYVLLVLGSLPPETEVPRYEHGHSYRGYYNCLAVQPTTSKTTARDAWLFFNGLNGQTYLGWKGGEWHMDLDSRVFIACEGMCGEPMSLPRLVGG